MRFTAYLVPDGIHKPLGALPAAALAALLLALLGLASGAQASSNCPNEVYRSGPGGTLPDCRAYELVSPPDKNGGEVDGGLIFNESTPPPPMQAAASGEAVTYASSTAFNESNAASAMLTSQYLSRRGPSGWYTQSIVPEQNLPGGFFAADEGQQEWSLFQGFSENLEHAFLLAYEPAPVPGAPAAHFNPYVRDSEGDAYQLLSNQAEGTAGFESADNFHYYGMSEGGRQVIFTTLGGALEEWNEGKLEQVNLLADGQPPEGVSTSFFDRYTPSFGLSEDAHGAISRGGSRVVWGVLSEKEGSQQFVDERLPNGQRVVHGPFPGFVEASNAEDSELFILNNGALKRYEVATGGVSEIVGPPQATVEGVFGASEDGSYVYFLASGVLAKGASSKAPNIYVWHNGTIDFVASVGREDYDFVGTDAFVNEPFTSPGNTKGFAHLVVDGTTRVSPNGHYFAFEASEPLTGYDNAPTEAGACSETLPSSDMLGTPSSNLTGRCIEVYEYDVASGRLACASCNSQGLPPVGNSVVPPEKHALTMISGWQTATVQQRYLLNDGRLFFDSYDELLPQATNFGKSNVYEYEPVGAGTCQSESGCQALISSGTSAENSWFVDTSESGSDVFFTTRQQLVAQDGDEAIDLYDARAGGGFSAATPPPCGGEACKPPVTPAPVIYQAPVSATFAGPGNLVQSAAGQPASTKAKKRTTKTKKHTAKGKKRAKKGKGATRKKRQPGARRAMLGSRVKASSRGRNR